MLPSPEDSPARPASLALATACASSFTTLRELVGAARVWWTLRLFGATDVKILEGGLPQWRAEGRPLEAGARARPRRVPLRRASMPQASPRRRDVLRASETGSAQIVDARSAGRFTGEVAEPRPGLRSGHIPAQPQRAVGQGRRRGTNQAAGRGRKRLRRGWRRSRPADHHNLRFGRHRRDPFARAGDASARPTSFSTTAPGANGARRPDCRSPSAASDQ